MTNHTLEKPKNWWRLHVSLIIPLKFGLDYCHTFKGRQIPSSTERERALEALRKPHTTRALTSREKGLQRALSVRGNVATTGGQMKAQ